MTFIQKQIPFLLIPAILFVAACGKDDGKQATTDPATQPAIEDLATIEQAADRGSLVGRNVALDNIRVDRVTGTYVFWAGSQNGIPVFRKDSFEKTVAEHVRREDRVRITGTVRLATAASPTDPLWEHINEQEKADILSARVFISADKVQVIH